VSAPLEGRGKSLQVVILDEVAQVPEELLDRLTTGTPVDRPFGARTGPLSIDPFELTPFGRRMLRDLMWSESLVSRPLPLCLLAGI
jgi:hypothetical protein